MESNKKVINSWCMYDWANSVYNLVINTSIFPIYYTAVTANEAGGDRVDFFGFEVVNSVLYSYAISISYLLSALMLPLLSGIADYTGEKKKYLKIFTTLGSLACMTMFFFNGDTLELGIICVVLASVGYSSGLVFYDAYLPEIAPASLTDRISARGYAFGYAGSALLLIASLVIISFYDVVGFPTKGDATRTVFLLVGVWWIGFAQIPFKNLPDNVFNRKPSGKILMNGYLELKKVFVELKKQADLRKYLLAFFFFNMGVQTIMLLATLFGSKELKMESGQLIPILLIIQFVAIGGAILFARLSERKGNIFSLGTMIIIWIGLCLFAYTVTTVTQFYIIAVVVGLMMGGIQSLSRATFSKLLPSNTVDHASYFSFYDVTFHISVVIGTFSYGFIEHLSGSMRNSTLALASYFILGFVLLIMVKMPKKNNASA
ncbi:MFS transporter [Marinoscillum sp. MHG1-6]|uniref:MFS transporter n=1 Tax=Marinoscillum sp. MHG1-6 TaxID=2959627 RepID=UPI0021576611|nr:MFS transporter [Marinoscillum sp. MHG1-6]